MTAATAPTLEETSFSEELARLHQSLDRLAARPVGPDDLGSLVVGVDRARRRLDALQLSLIAAAERSQVAAKSGLSGTEVWAARATQDTRQHAARDLRLARHLQSGTCPQTADALTSGDLSSGHAAVIAEALNRLPRHLDSAAHKQVEALLVTQSRRLDPGQLRRTARRALAAVEADTTAVDAHEDKLLADEEADAYARASLTLHDNADGTVTGHFTVPTLAGAILKKLLDTLTAPRRDRSELRRPWDQQRGQAFAELLEHLPTDHLPASTATTVIVTLDHDTLRSALRAAHLDTGERLSAGEARRLACQSGLLPAVLGGSSKVLDLGRRQRLFNDSQRMALAATHHSCAALGCERPYSWCELHHRQPWSHGGRTDLADAIPLCGHHHRLIHRADYRHRSSSGGIEFSRLRR